MNISLFWLMYIFLTCRKTFVAQQQFIRFQQRIMLLWCFNLIGKLRSWYLKLGNRETKLEMTQRGACISQKKKKKRWYYGKSLSCGKELQKWASGLPKDTLNISHIWREEQTHKRREKETVQRFQDNYGTYLWVCASLSEVMDVCFISRVATKGAWDQ